MIHFSKLTVTLTKVGRRWKSILISLYHRCMEAFFLSPLSEETSVVYIYGSYISKLGLPKIFSISFIFQFPTFSQNLSYVLTKNTTKLFANNSNRDHIGLRLRFKKLHPPLEIATFQIAGRCLSFLKRRLATVCSRCQ